MSTTVSYIDYKMFNNLKTKQIQFRVQLACSVQ